MTPEQVFAIVQRVRAEYPEKVTAEQVGEMNYRIAREAGKDWGLLLKPHGASCPSPIGFISLDILVHIPEEQEYDIWIGADGPDGTPGKATPTMHKLHFKVGGCGENPADGKWECSGAEMSRVKSVAGDEPTPVPTPVPPPTPEDDFEDDVEDAIVPVLIGLEALMERMAALEALVRERDTLITDMHRKLTQEGFHGRLDSRFFGGPITLK